MTDKKLAEIRWTISNIRRYRRLLETQLTEKEREFIKRRLSEERATLISLEAETFPMTFRWAQAGP
jgi:5-bromo-4-chloroindolyl phosphate hydrolysis protein